VAISKSGSDMLYKASQRIKKAWKRGYKVNFKVDDLGNPISNDDDKELSEGEDVIADNLCEPTKCYICSIHSSATRRSPSSVR